jgi:hypothetical protein
MNVFQMILASVLAWVLLNPACLAAAESPPVSAAVQAEWERDWAWHYPDGKPRPARVPANRPHHPLALTDLSPDRDLLDVVLSRTDALLKDLTGLSGAADLSRERAAWQALTGEAAKVARSDMAARRAIYLRACQLRRQVALANPLLNCREILFAKTVAGDLSMYSLSGGISTAPGSALCAVSDYRTNKPAVRDLLDGRTVTNGRNVGKAIAGRGCFADPDLDYDGQRIAFAWNELPRPFYYYGEFRTRKAETAANARQIFRVEVDGSDLRQLTEGREVSFAPCWLPSGRIAFISQRDPGTNRCRFGAIGPQLDDWFRDGYVPYHVPRIYSMAADGSDARRHSQHDAAEWTPSVDSDGCLAYGRWDYIDRGIPLQSFWTQHPDGRDPRCPHGNYPIVNRRHVGCAPTVGATYMRAVPGARGKHVYVTSNHRIYEWGALMLLDLGLPDADNGNQLLEITPDLAYPTSGHDGGLGRDGPVYSTPWPLSDRYFLVAFRRELPPMPVKVREHPYEQMPKFGLYLLDIYGNRELLYRDDAIDCMKPVPFQARPRPPVVPDQVRDTRGQGPSKAATIAVMNVYESDSVWPKDTKITALRIVQVFQNYGGGDDPPMGFSGMALPRIPLGTVPVYEDGSAYFEAPVNRMIYFQALDGNGLAVQSMRSGTSVQPGERLTCVGCHENKWKTPSRPQGQAAPLAFRRGTPDRITPEVCGTEPFTFARHVQPILTAKCAGCHVKEKKGPQKLADTGLVTFKGGRNHSGQASAAFSDLRPYTFFYVQSYGIQNNRSVAGQIGARAAKLTACLSPKHHGAQLTDQERRLFTMWMDLLSPYYSSIFDRDKQHAGEVVDPLYPDFDPNNFFGVEGRPVPAKTPPRLTAAGIASRISAATGEEKASLLELLGRLNADNYPDVYLAALSDQSPAVRACGLRFAGNMGDGRFLPPLVTAIRGADSHDQAGGYEKPAAAVCMRMKDRKSCVTAVTGALDGATPAGQCALLRLLGRLGGDEAAPAVKKVLAETKASPENIALRAKASASSELKPATAARFAIDGHIPNKGGGADDNAAWAANGKAPMPVSFTLEWDKAVRIAEVVYHGRTAWSDQECWKDCELYVDDAATPAAKVRFTAAYGPQSVRLAGPAMASKLTLKFLSSHGGANPGASEIKVFSEAAADPDAAELHATAEAVLAQMRGR